MGERTRYKPLLVEVNETADGLTISGKDLSRYGLMHDTNYTVLQMAGDSHAWISPRRPTKSEG